MFAVLLGATPLRLLDKVLNPTVVVRDHDPEFRGLLHLHQADAGDGAGGAMGLHQFRQVHVAEVIGADKEKVLFAEEGLAALEAAGRPEQLLFIGVAQGKTVGASVAERVLQIAGEIVNVSDHVGEAMAREVVEHVGHHRTVRDGEQGLGNAIRQGTHSLPYSGRQHHRLHARLLMKDGRGGAADGDDFDAEALRTCRRRRIGTGRSLLPGRSFPHADHLPRHGAKEGAILGEGDHVNIIAITADQGAGGNHHLAGGDAGMEGRCRGRLS